MGARIEGCVVAAIAGVLACSSGGVFVCTQDGACVTAEQRGRCEPTGYCSFPDDTCPSGWSYGAHASAELAGQCVEGDDASTGSTTASGDASTTTTNASSDADTIAVDDTASTGESTTSTSGPQSESSNGDAVASTSTNGAPSLQCWTDDFSGGGLGDFWCPYQNPSLMIAESEGALHCSIGPFASGAYAGIEHCASVDLTSGSVAVALVQAPNDLLLAGIYLEVYGPALDGFGIAVDHENLYRYVFDADTSYGNTFTPYDPAVHRFLRLREQDGWVHFEHSQNAAEWTELASVPDETGVFAAGWMNLGCGVPEGGSAFGDSAIFDDVEVCAVRE